jgi:ribosomal protein S18 acetylase RimI-like enzyme
MADRASGFCIYDDVALAIARARRDGLRVMYIDLDVHHGDGVQAIHWADPGVLTFSIHETGRTLFPWNHDGEASVVGEGAAAGSVVNVPLMPGTGERAWVASLESLLPDLAAAFGPDLIVSQHGADSHAWDPLAHLAVTTTAHGRAARLVDALVHRHARGRWLATGGGGYDAYRVVPRTWTLVWLAGAHREAPSATPGAWRERWSGEAARYGQSPLPETFDDAPGAGVELGAAGEAAEAGSTGVAALVRRVHVPRLVREARDRGWWDPLEAPVAVSGDGAGPIRGAPTVLARVERDTWSRLTLAPWIVPPAAPSDGHALVAAALADGARVTAAVVGTTVVGLVVSRHADDAARSDILAMGVAPDHRRLGLATAMLRTHLEGMRPGDVDVAAEVTLAERDWFAPLDLRDRAAIARRLLDRAGFEVSEASPEIRSIDPSAIVAQRSALRGNS